MEYPFKKIVIQIIPAGCQREPWLYGDYSIGEKGELEIRVSQYENPDDAMRIIIHELLEAWRYARKHGADFSAIDDFDIANKDNDDPGKLPEAPYHVEHTLSEEVEMLLCHQDGVDFDTYYDTEPIGVKNGTL